MVAAADIECGLQRASQAAENARDVIEASLGAVGGLDRQVPPDCPLVRLFETLPKRPAEEWATVARSFERMGAGETGAVAGGYGEPSAPARWVDSAFYPSGGANTTSVSSRSRWQ